MRAVTIVIATRDRRERLLETLERLEALPEAPRVVVVDDGSRDGTAEAVGRRHPAVTVLAAAGARRSARTLGAEAARTPYVAFNDDDSWWEPGALERAARLLDEHPRLALVAARIMVQPDGRLDPTCAVMERSPLFDRHAIPGRPVLGFVACGAVVRRSALLEVGGFSSALGFGGEEQLLAIDLAAAGWALRYVEDVVAHHEPGSGDRPGRSRVTRRNELLTTWARRPARSALAHTARVVAGGGPAGVLALADAARRVRWVADRRRVVPPDVEDGLRRLETGVGPSVLLPAPRGG